MSAILNGKLRQAAAALAAGDHLALLGARRQLSLSVVSLYRDRYEDEVRLADWPSLTRHVAARLQALTAQPRIPSQ